MAVKAYMVEDRCGDHTPEVVFAETPGKAKAGTANLCSWLSFTEMSVCRAQEYDKYVGRGGPTPQQLFEHHGWWFECDKCRKQTTSDEGVWTGEGVRCLSCEEQKGE